MLNLNLDNLFLKIIAYCSLFGLTCNFLMSIKWGYIGTALNILLVETFVTFVLYFALKKRGISLVKIKNFMPKEIWSFLNGLIRKYY